MNRKSWVIYLKKLKLIKRILNNCFQKVYSFVSGKLDWSRKTKD